MLRVCTPWGNGTVDVQLGSEPVCHSEDGSRWQEKETEQKGNVTEISLPEGTLVYQRLH